MNVNNKLHVFFVCALMLFGLVGCTVKTVNNPVTVTTKLLPELPAMEQAAQEVTGKSCSRVVLLIIPAGFATAEDAYAEALGQAPWSRHDAQLRGAGEPPLYFPILLPGLHRSSRLGRRVSSIAGREPRTRGACSTSPRS